MGGPAGAFAAATGVVHSVLGDITDTTNQATAFPIYGLIWPLGATIGYVAFPFIHTHAMCETE